MQLATLVSVNVARLEPQLVDYSGGFNNIGVLYQLSILDPSGPTNDPVWLGDHVSMFECSSQRVIESRALSSDFAESLTNVFNAGGFVAAKNAGNFLIVSGGATATTAFEYNTPYCAGCAIDSDHVMGVNSSVSGSVGSVYLDTATTMTVSSNLTFGVAGGPLVSVMYGPGAFDIIFQSRLRYRQADGAVSTFRLSGAMQINDGTTACSATSASPSTINCGIAITPSNLAATAGASGFGNSAFILGGGMITSNGH